MRLDRDDVICQGAGVEAERLRSQLAERVAELAMNLGVSVGAAESLTGGMIANALAAAPQASRWFRGAIVAYASEVKYQLLEVPHGPVVSEPAARAMAAGARRLLEADLTVSVTGAGGPDPQEGQPPGTVFLGLDSAQGSSVEQLDIPSGDPTKVCASTAAVALLALVEVLEARAAQ